MTWRVQWRERKGENRLPGEIRHDDFILAADAQNRVRFLFDQGPCWIFYEDLDAGHKGSSTERSKERQAKKARGR